MKADKLSIEFKIVDASMDKLKTILKRAKEFKSGASKGASAFSLLSFVRKQMDADNGSME